MVERAILDDYPRWVWQGSYVRSRQEAGIVASFNKAPYLRLLNERCGITTARPLRARSSYDS